MKIRSGFVSNSSSSSFIIAINKSEKCPTCGRRDHNFLDFVEKQGESFYSGTDDTGVKARTAEEVIKYINDHYQFMTGDDHNPDEYKEVFKKIKKMEKEGKEVGFVTISYHDESTNEEYSRQKYTTAIEEIWSNR